MAKTWALVVCFINVVYNFWKTLLNGIIPSSFRTYKSIKGEIALITGGGNGLGRELALKLSKLGASVVVWDVDQTGMEETCGRVRAQGGQAKGYLCDVSKREEIYAVAAKVKEEVGTVTILVNNAGVANGKMLMDIPDQAIEKVFNINAMSHFWTCKAFLPDMIKSKKGHIVAIASIAGFCAMVKATEYVSAKHAVVGFMEALKLELHLLGVPEIATTTVCPWFINTGMFTCKYDGLIPMLKTSEVVEEVIDGILLEKEKVVVPRSFYVIAPWKIFMCSSVMFNLSNVFGGRKLVESIKLTRSPSK